MVYVGRTSVLVALLCVAAVLCAEKKDKEPETKKKEEVTTTAAPDKERSKSTRSTNKQEATDRVLNTAGTRVQSVYGAAPSGAPSGYGHAFQPEALDLTGFFGPQFIVNKDVHGIALDAMYGQYAGQYQAAHLSASPDLAAYLKSTASPISNKQTLRQSVIYRPQQSSAARRPASAAVAYNPVFQAQKQPFTNPATYSSSYQAQQQQVGPVTFANSAQSTRPHYTLQSQNQLQPTPTPYAFVLPNQRNPTAAEYDSVYQKSPEPSRAPVRPSPIDYSSIIYGHAAPSSIAKQPPSTALQPNAYYVPQYATQGSSSASGIDPSAYYVPKSTRPPQPSVNPGVYYAPQPSKQPAPSAYAAQPQQAHPAAVAPRPQIDYNAIINSQVLPQLKGAQGVQLLDLSELYGAQAGRGPAQHVPQQYYQVSQAGQQASFSPVQLSNLLQQVQGAQPTQGQPQHPTLGPANQAELAYFQQQLLQIQRQQQQQQPQQQYVVPTLSPAQIAAFYQQQGVQPPPSPGSHGSHGSHAQSTAAAATASAAQDPSQYLGASAAHPSAGGAQQQVHNSLYAAALAGSPASQGHPANLAALYGQQVAHPGVVYVNPGQDPRLSAGPSALAYFAQQQQQQRVGPTVSSLGLSGQQSSGAHEAVSGYYETTATPAPQRSRPLKQAQPTQAAPLEDEDDSPAPSPTPTSGQVTAASKPSKIRQLVKKPHSFGSGYSFEIVG